MLLGNDEIHFQLKRLIVIDHWSMQIMQMVQTWYPVDEQVSFLLILSKKKFLIFFDIVSIFVCFRN